MSENTGRWLQEEHERFLQGLKVFGKKWTRVAQVVQTRTTVQVRSHAQKYFQKMVKGELDDGMMLVHQQGAVTIADQSDIGEGIPPVLQPYIPGDSSDLAIGLYNYLSPMEIPGSNRGHIPTWYQHGQGMERLLVEAETLDWQADSGQEKERQSDHPDPDTNRPEAVMAPRQHDVDQNLELIGNADDTKENLIHQNFFAQMAANSEEPEYNGADVGVSHWSNADTCSGAFANDDCLLEPSNDPSSTTNGAGSMCSEGCDLPMFDPHFSTMEVDEHLFEALIEDHEFHGGRRIF
mmetsp:Transcript_13526/g.17908  ORF Transcript_13526/g.17908 Transcript_13526/m.17908 type:complete len:293 (-) Transcript_13526:1183-2061(-)|eukprot:CAMPEP_0185758960 /NCGR_PEP_ID=MMETSP1174-20130828/17651_1 /TAXON_ID=35687 /ORGANISM="Dictyocha speculum, Strain CCMP1381" /LENGTH=292 /DNA_ID=CAMNT_0028439055 /DNA_START=206 /DNA_END=1084 /DNA_ORIENTATION=-